MRAQLERDAFGYATSWHGRAGRHLRAVAMATALVAVTLPVSAGRAQVIAPAEKSVAVLGTGTASEPAASASVQILLGRGGRQFGFSRGPRGGGSFESASATVIEDGPSTSVQATPEGGRRQRRERPGPLTREALTPIAADVASAAGIAPEAITLDLSPFATEPGGERSESARLEFELARPTPAGVDQLLAAASDAASANGLVVEVAGVRYNPVDCATVEEAAERAAIADARTRAERLARGLGVTIGGVTMASADLYASWPDDLGGCAGQTSAYYDSGYGGLGITLPVFDPSAPAEVTVTAHLMIAYEIVGR